MMEIASADSYVRRLGNFYSKDEIDAVHKNRLHNIQNTPIKYVDFSIAPTQAMYTYGYDLLGQPKNAQIEIYKDSKNKPTTYLHELVHASTMSNKGLSKGEQEYIKRQGEPVAYLLGVREFFGRQFGVTPAVLIPRPETELIVELVLSRSTALNNIPAILDLGTGSGALAVTLALELPGARLVAVDCSAEALGVARRNADALGAQVEFIESDWFAALPGRRFDFIVSNPPYIADGDPHLAEGDVRFEPPGALASGHAGLDDLARIAADAPAFLVPGGWLMMEHGYDQAGAVRGLLASPGFDDVASARDLAGIERVRFGRWRAS